MPSKKMIRKFANYVGDHGLDLAAKPAVRKFAVNTALRMAEEGYQSNLEKGIYAPGECEDRYAMSQAIIDTVERILTSPYPIAPTFIKKLSDIMVKSIVIEGGDVKRQQDFKAIHGRRPPGFRSEEHTF